MFGSGAQMLWLLGIVLGAISLGDNGFTVYPSSAILLAIIMALGILDAMAGLLAWGTIFLGALVTGHLRSTEDLGTTIGLAGIAVSLALLANYLRPIRREPGRGAGYVFDRMADYLIPAVVLAFGAAGMANGLNALSGLTLITPEETDLIKMVAGVAVLARMALEDVATHLYPERMAAVQITTGVRQSTVNRVAAITLRGILTLLVLSAFVGLTPMAMLLTVLLITPLLLRTWAHRLPTSTVVGRVLPKGLVKVTLMTVAGVLIAGWIFGSPTLASLTPWILGLLLLPSAILGVFEVFGRASGESTPSWVPRLAGVAVWALLAGVLSGVIVLAI